LPPRPGPLPVDAWILSPPTAAVVLFDQRLTTVAVLDVGNWTVNYGGFDYPVTAAAAAGSRVNLSLAGGAEGLPGNWVTFAPPPFDVLSHWGVAAPAFTQYPLRAGP
jgi:hypothetical protein